MKDLIPESVIERIVVGLLIIVMLCMLFSAFAGMVYFAIKSIKVILFIAVFLYVAYKLGGR